MSARLEHSETSARQVGQMLSAGLVCNCTVLMWACAWSVCASGTQNSPCEMSLHMQV